MSPVRTALATFATLAVAADAAPKDSVRVDAGRGDFMRTSEAGEAGGAKGTPPHIIMILTDDLGWNSAYNNERTKTPFIDELAGSEGVKLTSHYTYKYCAPTRGSFLTGRFPYHLSATRVNYSPHSVTDGIDLGYNLLPKHLAKAGYYTAHIGKWHLGFFSEEYTPVGRGFDFSFGFLEGGEDHWTSATFNSVLHCKPNGVDLSYGWKNGTAVRAARGRNGTYTGYLFAEEAVAVIDDHAARRPGQALFLYLALHNTHAPIQAPERFQDLYAGTPVASDPLEVQFNAMVSFVDETVRNVTEALRRGGMWDSTLLVWTTDNGAPVTVAGSNHPLRGGKGSDWEGGTRTPAFVAGGVLPKQMWGRTLNGIAHICDWYATFSALAGLGAEADQAGPAPPESLDLSPWLLGRSPESPRSIVVYDHRMYSKEELEAPTGAIRVGDLKLLVGPEGGVQQASWYGIFSPNNTGGRPSIAPSACPYSAPCLFNVSSAEGGDMTEHLDLAPQRPEEVQRLLAVFRQLAGTYHPPQENPPREDAQYCGAMAANGGFVRPWRRRRPVARASAAELVLLT